MTFNSYQRPNTTEQNYQYNGKELQDELDVNWLDYGARMYMADIGRWGVIDPLSELDMSVSVFGYVRNNPLRYNDPTGMFAEESQKDLASTFIAPDGTILDVRDDGDNNIYLIHSLAAWNPVGNDSDKDGLAVIGHTPDPASLAPYKGQNIYSANVQKYMNAQEEEAFVFNKDQMEGMVLIMKSRDEQIKLLLRQRELMIEQMYYALMLMKNGDSQYLLEKWKDWTGTNYAGAFALEMAAWRYGKGFSGEAIGEMIGILRNEMQNKIDQNYNQNLKALEEKYKQKINIHNR